MSFNRITISYLHNRGLSQQTVKLDQLVPRSFFLRRFPTRRIRLDDIRFDDFVQFLALEFGRLRHRESQRVWLMVIRSLLRFLAQRGHIPGGWDSAQPGIGNYLHARLPRCLSPEQVRSLFQASVAANRAICAIERCCSSFFDSACGSEKLPGSGFAILTGEPEP